MRDYVVTINGIEMTMRLSDEDAARYGDKAQPVDSKATAEPSTKARKSVANKAAPKDE